MNGRDQLSFTPVQVPLSFVDPDPSFSVWDEEALAGSSHRGHVTAQGSEDALGLGMKFGNGNNAALRDSSELEHGSEGDFRFDTSPAPSTPEEPTSTPTFQYTPPPTSPITPIPLVKLSSPRERESKVPHFSPSFPLPLFSGPGSSTAISRLPTAVPIIYSESSFNNSRSRSGSRDDVIVEEDEPEEEEEENPSVLDARNRNSQCGSREGSPSNYSSLPNSLTNSHFNGQYNLDQQKPP